MNFTEIFNGMVGKDFIVAFNDNFRTTDRTLLSILATLLYKVKSTDIKEFKVIEGVVSYTLEEPPEEGEEDTREWKPVDITRWGNILGDLEDQTDLKEALDSKAALETVEGLNSILSTLRLEFNNLRDSYEDTEIIVTQNQQDVADLKQVNRTKVTSNNIKAIRVSDAEFQWSTDGVTWMSIPITTSIAWGNLTGDIENQGDLMDLFDNITNTVTSLNDTVGTLNNTVASAVSDVDDLSDDVSALNTLISTKDTQYTTRFNNIDSDIAGLQSADTTIEGKIDEHTEDLNNPHQVTKSQIGLGNVDNTADADKPVSTAQRNYVDEQISNLAPTINSKVGYLGLASKIFVGTSEVYNSIEDKENILAFVLKYNWQYAINDEILFRYKNPSIVGTVRIKQNDQASGYYGRVYSSGDVIMGGSTSSFSYIPDGHYSIDYIKYKVTFQGYADPNTGNSFKVESPAHTDNILLGIGRMKLTDDEVVYINREIDAYIEENDIDYLEEVVFWVPSILTAGDISIESDDHEVILSEATYYEPEPEVSGFRCARFRVDSGSTETNILLDKAYTLSYSLPGDTEQRQVSFTLTTSNVLLPLLLVDDNLGTPPEIYTSDFTVEQGGEVTPTPVPTPVEPEDPENEG